MPTKNTQPKIEMTVTVCTFTAITDALESQLQEDASTLVHACDSDQRAQAMHRARIALDALQDIGMFHSEVD